MVYYYKEALEPIFPLKGMINVRWLQERHRATNHIDLEVSTFNVKGRFRSRMWQDRGVLFKPPCEHQVKPGCAQCVYERQEHMCIELLRMQGLVLNTYL
jgi:hypothetical protein